MDAYIIVTRPDCIWCDRAKALLASMNQSYTEIRADSDAGAEIMKGGGFKTVPQIFDGIYHVGGFTDLVDYID